MAAPVMSFGVIGNALASQSLGASANVTFNLDLSTAFEGQLDVQCNFGTIAATAGLQIQVFPGIGSVPTYSTTNPNYTYTLPAVSGLQRTPKIFLSTGKYQISCTNLDASNGVTVLQGTVDSVASVS